ncbi:MAG: UbiX family flavin prenyltransferase [Deltaproteobacteria bacterium]|nr:UbiX family flavin prenyltransferase [Deltaproteobacteria bacterium]MBW1957748.1 UbiX family flavin prenyltransferase [Deltaproteobacteria bacterium]MBW2015030.1 UbiX family flavin prenyltransferase [Deltaproteobacteria bacterium]MBW2089483.1 UbiX family flavin prenyltransferase [Deltaproteobacteria bacterium]MBW2320379.1 UbiX family flavin prenyltransferase [Deltaproteobacteria bacterium]
MFMIVVAISGASGPIMGVRLIEELLNSEEKVAAIVSQPARQIIEYEILGEKRSFSSLEELLSRRGLSGNYDLLSEFKNNDFFAPVASGSTKFEAMVVIPCSMKTLSAIVHGYANSLITRTCDVALKEKRRCIIVPRETPLSVVHTENIHRAAMAGIDIVPPVPGFYTRPESVDDVVNFVVGKVLNLLGREHDLFESWGKKEP